MHSATIVKITNKFRQDNRMSRLISTFNDNHSSNAARTAAQYSTCIIHCLCVQNTWKLLFLLGRA